MVQFSRQSAFMMWSLLAARRISEVPSSQHRNHPPPKRLRQTEILTAPVGGSFYRHVAGGANRLFPLVLAHAFITHFQKRRSS